MGKIAEWLSDPERNYNEGIALYGSVRYNRNIMSMLQRKQSKPNMDKLIYELGKFADVKPVVAVVKKTSPDQTPALKSVIDIAIESAEKQSHFPKVMFHDLPEELRPTLLEAHSLFRANCLLKVKLNDMPDDAEDECFKIQTEIDDNFKKNALCWKKIDYWLEHRALPEPPKSKTDDLTPAGLLRKQGLLYSSISKLKKRVESKRNELRAKPDVPNKSKIEKQLAKQEKNLLKQEEELILVSNLIDGKHA